MAEAKLAATVNNPCKFFSVSFASKQICAHEYLTDSSYFYDSLFHQKIIYAELFR